MLPAHHNHNPKTAKKSIISNQSHPFFLHHHHPPAATAPTIPHPTGIPTRPYSTKDPITAPITAQTVSHKVKLNISSSFASSRHRRQTIKLAQIVPATT